MSELEKLDKIIALLKSINKKLGDQEAQPVLKKLPKSTKKLTAGAYSVAKKPCNRCGGLISWDGYDKANPTPPIHVDEKGHVIGNGSCPEFEEEEE